MDFNICTELSACADKIDFVLIWVDDEDPTWQASYRQYSEMEFGDARSVRFRDWGTLKYWFRGVEKFAPWVNSIYFITCGHYPEWLNIQHPKIKFIKHTDYIPKEYLPTFNSHTIELNLHRIESLSERFVYFNDDTFIINHISPDRFFLGDNVCDIAVLNAPQPKGEMMDYIMANNVGFVNRHFNKHKIITRNLRKWFALRYSGLLLRTLALSSYPSFTGLYDPHLPNPFFKSTLRKVWDMDGNVLDETCRCKFRSYNNVSQYVFRYYQLMTSRFKPINPWKSSVTHYISGPDSMSHIINEIRRQRKSLICINDGEIVDFENAKILLRDAFDEILPTKSSFEK